VCGVTFLYVKIIDLLNIYFYVKKRRHQPLPLYCVPDDGHLWAETCSSYILIIIIIIIIIILLLLLKRKVGPHNRKCDIDSRLTIVIMKWPYLFICDMECTDIRMPGYVYKRTQAGTALGYHCICSLCGSGPCIWCTMFVPVLSAPAVM
jgi:hypothetical protein